MSVSFRRRVTGERRRSGRGSLLAACAALACAGVVGVGLLGAAPDGPVAPAASGVDAAFGSGPWSGQFSGYGSGAWKKSWGVASSGAWGSSQLKGVKDASAPGDGSALQVTYGAGSSANSCSDCPNPGGGQFYTQLGAIGRSDLAKSATLDLKYGLKLPAGFDFGKGGKLPGLYGGKIGAESGGNHGRGWSTRYMFRAKSHPDDGEVYLYTPTNSGPTGYGVDVGLGSWRWLADGGWHTVEQLVNRTTGDVTVWYDGKQALVAKGTASGISGIDFGGVFFSTFFGGHDTSWGPKKTERAEFADFSLSASVQH
ncbi:polysaccharide lyase [Streptomyces celluloflavus]|uniref:polysaccharide lyase n=1 Tax=Streptomyces celluloflavus TaxID=58344 RepID=UPI0036A0C7C5